MLNERPTCKRCKGDGDGNCGYPCDRCLGTGQEPPSPAECDHRQFDATVTVNRLEDTGRFNADIRIKCVVCGTPFRFIGLPAGVDQNGAAVSIDGTEGRFAIAPKGQVITPLEGLGGFTVRRKT